MNRTASLLGLALALALLTGCAGVLRSYDIGPSGLMRSEENLRRTLAAGLADSALVQRTLTGESAPGDELLRALYGGIAAYYAGRYGESGALLDVASAISEERATKSVSRSALALITNDKALPYEPSRTERLLIPYYGALAYLRQQDLEGAAVEARRLAALLEQDETELEADAQRLHGALRYFAGAVFEAYGDRNDAAVSYRHAAGLGALDTVAPRVPRDSGDVVVVFDHGFVAHRVEQSLNVLLVPDELHRLRDGEPHLRLAFGNELAGRVLTHAAPDGRPGGAPGYVPPPPTNTAVLAQPRERRCNEDQADPADRPRSIGEVLRPAGDSAKPARGVGRRTSQRECDDEDDAPYLLRVAWPTYRSSGAAPGTVQVVAGGSARGMSLQFADISGAVVDDFRRELPLIIARTLVRGAAKAAITRAAEQKLEEKDETLGKLVGILGNVGNVLLERADTRSWHLLPGAIGLARVRLPAGERLLSLRQADGSELDLGSVRVSAGRVVLVHARAW